jgi:hypothetical protein
MLRVGERSGNMGEMMERIAAFYDDEARRALSMSPPASIEPAMMAVIGLVIGGIVVLMYFPIFESRWEHPMNAALIDLRVVADTPEIPDIPDDVIRSALAAAQDGRTVIARLMELTGLDGEALALSLGSKLDYPVLSDVALLDLPPAFDVLGPTDAARRGCVAVRRGSELLAVTSDPFHPGIRGWVEVRVHAPLQWTIASR